MRQIAWGGEIKTLLPSLTGMRRLGIVRKGISIKAHLFSLLLGLLLRGHSMGRLGNSRPTVVELLRGIVLLRIFRSGDHSGGRGIESIISETSGTSGDSSECKLSSELEAS
eukprot:3438049-Amphidinium_carterae.1